MVEKKAPKFHKGNTVQHVIYKEPFKVHAIVEQFGRYRYRAKGYGVLYTEENLELVKRLK